MEELKTIIELFFVIGIIGVFICLIFGLILKRYKWSEDSD